MSELLDKNFFNNNTLKIAEDLIGKYLVINQKEYMITETEAYDGHKDKASHAHKGKTKRTRVMFGPPGFWYVYLIYGMYWMLNIVTGPQDYPAAVLIRGVEGIDGPGKITRELNIDDRFNNKPASKQTGLWIEDRGEKIIKNNIIRTSRVGVDYAKEWKNKPFRFILKID